jgi:hypothetical protein
MPTDPYVIEALKTYVLQVAAGSVALTTALSVWLGRVMAKRIELREQARHSRELEQLRVDLGFLRDKALGAHNLKIDLYRDVTEPLIKFMIDVETGKLTESAHIDFNRDRFRSYARLAMFAPQSVLDAYDEIVDYLNDLLEAKHGYDWSVVRKLSQAFLNAARADVAIGTGSIGYKGKR